VAFAPAPAPPRPAPPRSTEELALRAQALCGRTLSELAQALGVAVPDRSRKKGAAGQLIERALGARAGSAPRPDFEPLGIELKTIPVDEKGWPCESTFVCTIAPFEIAYEEWPTSRVRAKLSHVLWVPILAHSPHRILASRLWRPSPAQEQVLREDWEELAGLVAIGAIDELTAHRGRALQVRPKAAHARVRSLAPGPDGTPRLALPRGFYLRARFTGHILQERECV